MNEVEKSPNSTIESTPNQESTSGKIDLYELLAELRLG